MVTPVILLNKPFDVLCQFTDRSNADSPRRNLSDYVSVPGYYPAGRLDRDSEGLVVLTNDGKLQQKISHPRFKQPKIYLVQVDNTITDSALEQLRAGVALKDGPCAGVNVHHCDEPDWLWPRDPPVRFRKAIPTSWIRLTLTEGRNRQVRRMTAAVGFPTLRLVRLSVGHWSLDDLAPGTWRYTPIK